MSAEYLDNINSLLSLDDINDEIHFSGWRKKILIAFGSVRTDLTEEGANSTLSVAKINKSDSGEKLQDLN